MIHEIYALKCSPANAQQEATQQVQAPWQILWSLVVE
jgi:hypothetical protein